MLTGLGLDEAAGATGDHINFKFLKYGTGFFAGNFREDLSKHILTGVIDGLETLFREHSPKNIKALEFPFYTEDPMSHTRLETLKSKYGLAGIRFSHEDALKTTIPNLVTGTTNCADPHAPFGNEMSWGSVDGAIGENLKTKGNIFCPCLNKSMKEKFIKI